MKFYAFIAVMAVMVSAARGRVRRGAASAARAAHRKGVVDANIWGLVALLG